MLVEEQMELVGGRACHNPVVPFVQGEEDHRVSEDPVEELAALLARSGGESDRQEAQSAEALDLTPFLAEMRLR